MWKKMMVSILIVSMMLGMMPVNVVLAAEDVTYHKDIKDTAADLRKGMVNREETIAVGYSSDNMQEEITEEFVEELFHQAVAHTGNPKEGDYLYWQFDYNNTSMDYEVGMFGIKFIFHLKYYTTAEQEKELDTLISELLNDLKVDSMADNYMKIKTIYEYLCENISFDQEHQNDSSYTLQYTAYEALKNKTAACRGFSVLLYRLALELGIDSRVIVGTTGGQLHTWNLIQMDDNLYYNADAASDSYLNEHECFLLSDSSMPNHERNAEYATEEFYKEYPMGQSDYIYEPEPEPEPKPEPEPEPEVKLPFKDVKEDDWHYDAVVYVYANNLMKGMTDTTFEPDSKLNRAMFATILYRANDEPAVRYKNVFSDVPNGEWYTDGVMWAYDKGIVKGYDDGTFGTEDSITREQLAVMMYRYANYMGYDTTQTALLDQYEDAEMISDWAEDAMRWAVGCELVKGKTAATIDPLGEASRAECATIIMRFMELYK